MLLQNPFYSLLMEYTKKISSQIDSGYSFDTKYKSYDKDNENTIDFKFFDIESIIKTTSGIGIEKIQYENSLEFLYNKYTNEILIYKVPVLELGNDVKIPIFTHDIASIITKALSKYMDYSKIKISFKDKLSPLVIDDNVKSIIPSITDTENYSITTNILNNMDKELKKIQKTIDSYKAHQDRNTRVMEKIYERRRKIYGVDPIDYNSVDEFYDAVTNGLKEKIGYILNKIDRHMNFTKSAYEDLFLEQFREIYNQNSDYQYTKEELINKLNSEKLENDVFTVLLAEGDSFIVIDDEIIGDDYFNDWSGDYRGYKVLNSEIIDSSNNDYEILKKCVNIIWEHDIKNEKDGLLHFAKPLRKDSVEFYKDEKFGQCWQFFNIYFFEKINENHYKHLLKIYKSKDKTLFYEWKRAIDMGSLKFDNYGSLIVPNFTGPLFQALNLLFQYDSLNEQKNYYLNILNNIDNFTISSSNQASIQGYKYHLPYWFEEGNSNLTSRIGTHRKTGYRTRGNLLMIKPGCDFIDIEKIPYFYRPNRREKKRYNVELFESSKFYKFGKFENKTWEWVFTDYDVNTGEVMAITIPRSLPHTEIKKIIKYVRKEYQCTNINYICENPDIYTQVKSILIDYYLKDYEELRNKYVIKNSHICIDPNYYDEYFKTLPTTAEFFHKYDYTWDYKFRKKDILCIEDLCDIYINREKQKGDKIDYNKIKASILGGYSHLDYDNQLYKIDQYKYSALNYYIIVNPPGVSSSAKEMMKYPRYSKKKTWEDDFYNEFGNNDNVLKDRLFNNYDTHRIHINPLDYSYSRMLMITNDEGGYRTLSEEEIDVNVKKLGEIDNINVALFTGNSVLIWKNFPYTPLDKEEIPLDKVKTLIKKPTVKSLPNDY